MPKTMLLISFVFALLMGCKQGDEFTLDVIFPLDVQHGVCSERQIINEQTTSSKYITDHPLSYCDGFVAVPYPKWQEYRRWRLKQTTQGNQ